MKYIIIAIILILNCQTKRNNNISKKNNTIATETNTIFFSSSLDTLCKIPKEIHKYLNKNNIKFYTKLNLGDWKISSNYDSITCPTMILSDITGDNNEDFICIIDYNYAEKGEKDMYFPTLVIFEDFKSNLNPKKISGVKFYGSDIGTVIYLCESKGRKSICVDNRESSSLCIYYKEGFYKEEFISD